MVIIHFLPLENYPPIINLLNTIDNLESGEDITVITTNNSVGLKPIYCKNIKIKRIGQIYPQPYLRILHYLKFYIFGLITLLVRRPRKILWYETLSSLPAIIYYYLTWEKPKLFVHYHEYMSPEEIREGMVLVHWLHKVENKVYPNISWLSHTNELRLELFLNEHKMVKRDISKVLPNFPPQVWNKENPSKEFSQPIKLVYVGSFASFETIYIKEFVRWLEHNQPHFTLDIYSFEIPDEIKVYCSIPNLFFKGKLQYDQLPSILPQYDIGLILYKGHIKNYLLNAPNKLFEYLACGLDVWFPKKMIGTHPYTIEQSYPKVIPVDFDSLDHFNWKEAVNHDKLRYAPVQFYAEKALSPLITMLIEK